jgi:hypothetical protein
MYVYITMTFCFSLSAVNCEIHEVRVEPCREAAERKPCLLKRGRNASISFDYTPRKYLVHMIYPKRYLKPDKRKEKAMQSYLKLSTKNKLLVAVT